MVQPSITEGKNFGVSKMGFLVMALDFDLS